MPRNMVVSKRRRRRDNQQELEGCCADDVDRLRGLVADMGWKSLCMLPQRLRDTISITSTLYLYLVNVNCVKLGHQGGSHDSSVKV